MKNLLFPALFIVTTASAQTLQYSPFLGSGIYSKQFADAFSLCGNTAALANLSCFSAGVFSEQKYLLNEMKQYIAAVGLPIQKGGVGFIAAWGGFNHFNTSQLALAYGKQLGKVSAGIQFNYNTLRIAGYGSDAAIAVDIGSTWQVSKKLYTAIQLRNAMGGKYNKNSEERLSKLYTLGIGYESSDKLLINGAIIKEEDKPVTVCIGMQYIVAEKLHARFAISTVTASPFFSAGWKWRNCRADITANYHPQLGITPGLMLQFFGKKKSENKPEEF